MAIAVDVRDMLCAQALAVVAKAASTMTLGQALTIFYNAEDVKHDLLIWAEEQGYHVTLVSPTTVQLHAILRQT